MSDVDFYRNLTALDRFEEVAEPQNYTSVPDTWDVFVTDVRGSTKAIEAGRYKDVNVLGASGIVATLNACGRAKIPFVFGGDGATLLVPRTLADDVAIALAGVRRMATNAFGLELRVGRVPIGTIVNEGAKVRIAKYRVSETVELAMFDGGGLALADDLVKDSKDYEIPTPDDLPEPNLEGLQCRWKPIENSRGTMLTLMIVARSTDIAGRAQIYREILALIDEVIDSDASPARAKLEITSDTKDLDAESRAHSGQAEGFRKWVHRTRARAKIGIFKRMIRNNSNLGELNAGQYIEDVRSNTDFRKFDDCLRMVIDIEPADADQLREALQTYHAQQEILFGMHRSDTALMTCLVFDMQDDHVHFVDGNDGGYAMAARELKAQLKTINSG